jgi:hypothetical protein
MIVLAFCFVAADVIFSPILFPLVVKEGNEQNTQATQLQQRSLITSVGDQ